MMQTNVAQLLKAPTGSFRRHEVKEEVDVFGDGHYGQVRGDVEFLRTQRGVLVRATLLVEVELTCSRCLRTFTTDLSLDIEEEYMPIADVDTGAPLPAVEEPGAFTIDERHILDLTEAVRQYAIMAIPMKPLCREDCPGMRYANESGEPEADAAGAVDPRWARLTKLQ
ncbi:MAG: DUF177 domain-containing protein [Chloroflexi bacterium]|nr:DUF177 domain-containing protein [Chloroflexota bacterium]